MERHQNIEPPADPVDSLIESAYSESFAAIAEKIEVVYRELGAKVIYSASYTGEPEVGLRIVERQSEAMKTFCNRPA